MSADQPKTFGKAFTDAFEVHGVGEPHADDVAIARACWNAAIEAPGNE